MKKQIRPRNIQTKLDDMKVKVTLNIQSPMSTSVALWCRRCTDDGFCIFTFFVYWFTVNDPANEETPNST